MRSTTESAGGSDSRFLGTISSSSIRNLLPRSISYKKKTKSKLFRSENDPPLHPNITINDPPLSPSLPKPFNSPKSLHSIKDAPDSDVQPQLSPSPECPPLKVDSVTESVGKSDFPEASDPSVKVVVRIRDPNDQRREWNRTVRKVSSDSVSIGDRSFTFDSVLDSNSTQEDLFQEVGIPLVQSALAGYNASVLSYGQTGSGKTYTMWGPPSAMVEDPSPSSHQGIVPRVFQLLFDKIQKEQDNSEGKHINYQCRCSFLEIYNDQIGDLLDPVQRNLEIMDDPKNGLYVENLTEEYVTSYEDLSQILIKGLSNRKVGATSINSKSSRSHIVFTFIIESWCKGTSATCFSSSKISRISFIDLAGIDRNKPDDAGRQLVRESKHVKKSLSQLGHIVSTLAKGTQPGKSRDVPYEEFCLTHLLRESLGGNAKLTVLCTISPDNRNDSETLRTLRFGQQIKSIQNKPVINEISEDDVNDLSDQIRQLKEELIKAKYDTCKSTRSKRGSFSGRNVRDSLNSLRLSLNRSLMLPKIDIDSDDEANNVGVDDVLELHNHLKKLRSSGEVNLTDLSESRDSMHFTSVDQSFETAVMSEDEVNGPTENEETDSWRNKEFPSNLTPSGAVDSASIRNSISISLCRQSQVLQEPVLSESPRIGNTRKSVTISPSAFSSSRNNVSESSNFNSIGTSQTPRKSEHIRASLRSSNVLAGPTDSLAASLQRGSQIIEHHKRVSPSNRSSASFSFEHFALTSTASVQKSAEGSPSSKVSPTSLLCALCQEKIIVPDTLVLLATYVISIGHVYDNNQGSSSDLVEGSTREKELEIICKEQEAKIEQLNQVVEQYKHVAEQQNGHVLALEAPKHEESQGFMQTNEECEVKEVVLDNVGTAFDSREKEELLNEIESLKSKLKVYSDAPSSSMRSTDKLRSSLLARSIQFRKSIDIRNNSSFNEEEVEKERQRWIEMESDWISLTDELRIDIESSRRNAEKVEMELRLEKAVTEELDDALHRAMVGHARMVEHYADLQEKHNDLVGKHRAILERVAEVKRAAARAGTKGGNRFAKSLAAELSNLRVEREKEREFLRKENKSLKLQLRDTAEAVHAAGELLVRLKEAEQAASLAEERLRNVEEGNEKLKKQMDKQKRKYKMEMVTMKQYMAESRLPESALRRPMYQQEEEEEDSELPESTIPGDDQAWRAEFGAIYQDHHYCN
ncbi:Kinesin-like protein KIN-12F [Linum perenne]